MTELACGRPYHCHPLGVPPAQKLADRLYSYLLTATRASKLEAHKARDKSLSIQQDCHTSVEVVQEYALNRCQLLIFLISLSYILLLVR